MFGDNDLSKAKIIETTVTDFRDIVFEPGELWSFPPVRELFSGSLSEEEFSSAYRELLHYLVRTEAIYFDESLFQDEPLFYIAERERALVAQAIRYHLSDRNLAVPGWVLSDEYQRFRFSLKDLGVMQEAV